MTKLKKINSIQLGLIGLVFWFILLHFIEIFNNIKTKYFLFGFFSLIIGVILILTSYLAKKEGHKAMEGFYGGWLNAFIYGIFFILCSIYCFIVLIFDL